MDLKTVPAATKEAETYLYLGSPWLDLPAETMIRGFASALMDKDRNPSLGMGLEGQFGAKFGLSLEGFYTGRELPSRKSSAWFSVTPPLPPREFRLYGVGLLLNAPWLLISSDMAWSETFAVGRDFYGNLGLRIGNPKAPLGRRSFFSFAVDGAGPRYIGRDGSGPGAAFRMAGKFEWRGKKSSLFRLSAGLRAPALGEAFNRNTAAVYYRFPQANLPFRISRVSLSAGRDARNPAAVLDGLDWTFGFTLNPHAIRAFFLPDDPAGNRRLWSVPLGLVLSGGVDGVLTDKSYAFDSAKAAGELSWSPGPLQFKTKAGYAVKAEKEGVWDLSFSAAVHGKTGRFSLKIASPKFPEKWTYTISWRLNAAGS
jgi:hypothetical protein